MDLKRVLSFPPYPGDYLHPVVYACTAVMLLCLLVSIMTYIVHHSVIRISRRGWHTLLNLFFHTGLTFGVFAGGINQIHFPLACRIIGILLHYASLSTMLWLALTARNICKDVCKDPLRAQERSGPVKKRSKLTVLRYYLVSDGVPLIVVAITAGFGIDNYGSRDGALYCWMAWEPSLGGFYAPVGLLVLVMFTYFLITYIQLKRHPERKYELCLLNEDQQMLSSGESNHHCQGGGGGASGSSGDCLPFSTGVSVLANEHSFKSQLRATFFTLFLFLATWTLGALAVSQGYFLDMIFSCLYGAFCVTLGLFLLIQHCAKRDDVWNRWWVCCHSKTKIEDGNTDGQSQSQQPHCHLSSPCSGKQLLLSSHLLQSSFDKMTPPPHSPSPSNTGPCCVAVMSPASPIPSLIEPLSSPRPHSLPDDLPRPTLPLQRCLTERAKSRSFNRPRPCLQDYRSHMTSLSMDGSVHSSHRDSPLPSHHLEGTSLGSNSPLPDLQLPCPSPNLDKQITSCHTLQRQTSCQSAQDSVTSCHGHVHNMYDSINSCHSLLLPSQGLHSCQWHKYGSVNPSCNAACCESDPFTSQCEKDPQTYCGTSKTEDLDTEQRGFPRNTLPRQHSTIGRRGVIGRNRSLQEDGLFGSDATGNIRTGPWKNETTV
ncbi:adhesion G protein-coupled receptor A1 [Cyprinodon tularosa]|uniref:adhesion G protein-coupled receptor A1 n=1 Tax=Cyprinodon tularosa TaxID=77115 RepID=UPI0018E21F95|nr:adhesion G protein-coupled receptor A1 [Cyprinodon tularosa]